MNKAIQESLQRKAVTGPTVCPLITIYRAPIQEMRGRATYKKQKARSSVTFSPPLSFGTEEDRCLDREFADYLRGDEETRQTVRAGK